MRRSKENEEEEEDDDDSIRMAAAGFIFLASKVSKELKIKRHIGVRSKPSKRKVLMYMFLPISTFDCLIHVLSAMRKVHTALRQVCG
jgi:hypothetical protein